MLQEFHYAVWVGGQFMTAACNLNRLQWSDKGVLHYITIIRGQVSCPECLRMMGPS